MTGKFNIFLINNMSKKVEKFIDEAISNIRNDREITRELLDDAIKWLSKDESRHQQIGITLSKYVETLQRSNEQLVKIAAMMAKQQSYQEDLSLSDEETDNIFEIIQGEKANGE